MGVVFFLMFLPIIAVVVVAVFMLEILTRFFVIVSPLILIAVFIVYRIISKKGLFTKYTEGWQKAVSVAAKVAMIIYMIFNGLLFLFCLFYLLIYPGSLLV